MLQCGAIEYLKFQACPDRIIARLLQAKNVLAADALQESGIF